MPPPSLSTTTTQRVAGPGAPSTPRRGGRRVAGQQDRVAERRDAERRGHDAVDAVGAPVGVHRERPLGGCVALDVADRHRRGHDERPPGGTARTTARPRVRWRRPAVRRHGAPSCRRRPPPAACQRAAAVDGPPRARRGGGADQRRRCAQATTAAVPAGQTSRARRPPPRRRRCGQPLVDDTDEPGGPGATTSGRNASAAVPSGHGVEVRHRVGGERAEDRGSATTGQPSASAAACTAAPSASATKATIRPAARPARRRAARSPSRPEAVRRDPGPPVTGGGNGPKCPREAPERQVGGGAGRVAGGGDRPGSQQAPPAGTAGRDTGVGVPAHRPSVEVHLVDLGAPTSRSSGGRSAVQASSGTTAGRLDDGGVQLGRRWW